MEFFVGTSLRYYQILKWNKLAESEHPISSIAIDTWGVDFGLIDKDGAIRRTRTL